MLASKNRGPINAGVVAVGTLPPPHDGQSVAFEMLARHLSTTWGRFEIIDVSIRGAGSAEAGTTGRGRAYVLGLHALVRALARQRGDPMYLTIAQSLRGFLRDAAFISVARLFRSPVICHLHGGNYGAFFDSQNRLVRTLIRFFLRRASAILILGDSLRAMFEFDPILQARLWVVPNAVPPDIPIARDPRTLRLAGGARPQLLYLSNLVESKGYFTVLESVARLAEEYGLEAEVHFCGRFLTNPSDDRIVKSPDQARALFEREVERMGLSGSVTYHGSVSGAEKLDRLRRADFLVLPTRYDNEGQPICILEAMAFGIPVISTRYRAIPELIRDEETGYLVSPDSPGEIAKCISHLWRRPDLYEQMSSNSLAMVHEKFEPHVHLARIDEVLKRFAKSA